MLIGLTGRNASGKTTVVGWFSERGFVAESCSDSIRTWLAGKGVEATRENLIEGGRELRRQGGGGILAEMLLERLNGRDAVIDSIRTPAEVDALRRREDFILIEVVADPGIRWSRAKIRSRPGDPTSEADFIESEKKELLKSQYKPGLVFDMRDTILKTICAFGNTDGGIILIGVIDKIDNFFKRL